MQANTLESRGMTNSNNPETPQSLLRKPRKVFFGFGGGEEERPVRETGAAMHGMRTEAKSDPGKVVR